jgi:hypothetical protein
MKRIACLLVVVAIFALGWFSGRLAIESKTDHVSVASEVLKAHVFNSAYAGVTFCQAVISQIDSGRIEDAKQMVRTHQDSSIFALDSALDPAPISSEDMIALRDLNANIQSPHGSKREMADRILARVARHRADHPWTYNGALPHSTDPEVEAKLASILKQASESQK